MEQGQYKGHRKSMGEVGSKLFVMGFYGRCQCISSSVLLQANDYVEDIVLESVFKMSIKDESLRNGKSQL